MAFPSASSPASRVSSEDDSLIESHEPLRVESEGDALTSLRQLARALPSAHHPHQQQQQQQQVIEMPKPGRMVRTRTDSEDLINSFSVETSSLTTNTTRTFLSSRQMSFVADAELSALLESRDLGEYSALLAQNEIDMEAFMMLHESHLRSLGIPLGPRLKMLSVIRSLTDPTEIALKTATSTSSIEFHELVFQDIIGKGSFGVVYRGLWNSRVVAIKKVLATIDEEAELLGKLRHRNIIHCFGACFEAPNFCLVLEHATNNLRDAIRKSDLNPSTVVNWALQIATGMNYLHTEAPVPIIHRDLKPSNILLFPDGTLKISDFGLSRIRDEKDTEVMSSVGTYEYMAPEVIKNEPYSEKADIYSFGVVVWEMLTRQTPYGGLAPLAVAYGVGSGTLRLPMPANIPAFAAMLDKCWAQDPKLRWSFKELIRSLEAISVSNFTDISKEAFLQLQSEWNAGFLAIFEKTKKEYDMLKRREQQLSLAEISLSMREQELAQREQQLRQHLLSELTCWSTLKRWNEDTLGLGLCIRRGLPGTKSLVLISRVDIAAEYLSETAFFDNKVRHSLKRDLVLNYWLPVYICDCHGRCQHTRDLMEDAMFAIITGTEQRRQACLHDRKFVPGMALQVIAMLMNNVLAATVQDKMHPLKALDIYAVLHRMLLLFVDAYPELLTACQRKLQGFLASEERRHQHRVPNLGEFLVLLSIVDVNWSHFAGVFVPEMMQRSWTWLQKHHPEFANLTMEPRLRTVTFTSGVNDEVLLQKAFQGSRKGMEIVLLHTHLITKVLRADPNKSLADMAREYDSNYGFPPLKAKETFEHAFKQIMALNSFESFLASIGYPNPPTTPSEVVTMLYRAASNAVARGYMQTGQQKPRDAIEGGYVMVDG